jgi:hypothetical protein
LLFAILPNNKNHIILGKSNYKGEKTGASTAARLGNPIGKGKIRTSKSNFLPNDIKLLTSVIY